MFHNFENQSITTVNYCFKRVSHLILVDPWGIPKKPENVEEVLPVNRSLAIRAIQTIGQKVNALSIVRAAGPMGKIKMIN
jgi:hypothetical protein